jgi:hypothetical protein
MTMMGLATFLAEAARPATRGHGPPRWTRAEWMFFSGGVFGDYEKEHLCQDTAKVCEARSTIANYDRKRREIVAFVRKEL